MKITSQKNPNQQNYQPKFGQVYLIQVSKKAFSNPQNLDYVRDVFCNSVSKITKEMPFSLSNALAKLGVSRKSQKTFSFLESPTYPQIKKDLQESQAPSIHWFNFHIGNTVKEPLDQNYHSFYMLTKDDKNGLIDSFSPKNIKITWARLHSFMENAKSSIYQGLSNENILHSQKKDLYWIHAEFDKILAKNVKEPEKTFRINNLSELTEIFKEIAY